MKHLHLLLLSHHFSLLSAIPKSDLHQPTWEEFYCSARASVSFTFSPHHIQYRAWCLCKCYLLAWLEMLRCLLVASLLWVIQVKLLSVVFLSWIDTFNRFWTVRDFPIATCLPLLPRKWERSEDEVGINSVARAAFWWTIYIYICMTCVLLIVWSVCRSTDTWRVAMVSCKSLKKILTSVLRPNNKVVLVFSLKKIFLHVLGILLILTHKELWGFP
jgi:hypothetical protein